MKRLLTRMLFDDELLLVQRSRGISGRAVQLAQRWLGRRGYKLAHWRRVTADREIGAGWPLTGETMIGIKRLENIEDCIAQILRDAVRGDFIETGVWRGGACIYMRAVLAAHGVTDRTVWLADSFEGLPRPDAERFPKDKGLDLFEFADLRVSVDIVKANFARYQLLDDQVRFLVGWFSETLPNAPMERLALIRLDGDLYQSTWEAISALYPRLSPGGFLIVDDYGVIPACRAAIEDYRAQHHITEAIVPIDNDGVYWRKAN
jgi:O-methyltransferase